jgi:hypothetical protein
MSPIYTALQEINPLQLVSLLCFIGSLVMTVNSFLFYIILNFQLENLLNLILNWVGCVGGLAFTICAFLINFEFYKEYEFQLGIGEQIAYFIAFNGFTVMFIRQSNLFFSKLGSNVLWISYILLNIYNFVSTYYSLRYQLYEEESIYPIFHGLDSFQMIVFFIFEALSNIYGIYTIVKSVQKFQDVNINRLVFKMVLVLMFFVCLDASVIILEYCDLGLFAYCVLGLNYSIKSQVEYYCLGKVRQCIIVAQCHYNANN